jgi:PPK2 family polyphosphate:nucleotide phosphotransferase
MSFIKRLRVKPGAQFRLADIDPGSTAGAGGKAKALEIVDENQRRLFDLQYVLYAENKHSVLIVLQAMDTAGKDGVIRKVVAGLNPQGCTVTPFKAPSADELDHHFLWRIQKAVPARGEVAVFNRSHYEDVLVVRVNELAPKSVWSARYDQINAFEHMLADNGTVVLKFFLHISKDEQKQRLAERIADPAKHWKLAAADFEARKRWDDYMKAYEAALTRCSTAWAPWFVIPANKKWYRDLAVSNIIVEALEGLRMKLPKPKLDVSKLRLD